MEIRTALLLLVSTMAVTSYQPCSDFFQRLESAKSGELRASIVAKLKYADVSDFTHWRLDVTFTQEVHFNMHNLQLSMTDENLAPQTLDTSRMENVKETKIQSTDNKTFSITFKTRDIRTPSWSISVLLDFSVGFPGRYIDINSIKFNNYNICTDREICGEVPDSEFLIHNGQTVQHGEWPWVAAVHQRTSPITFNFLCAGTLVSRTHVITAAHCIRQRNSYCEFVDNEDVVVGLGVHKLLDFSSSRMQLISVKDTLVHHEWGISSNTGNDADIAMLLLSRPAHFTNYIKPACISYKLPVETIGKIIGWGLTETGEFLSAPRSVSLPSVSNKLCRASDPRFIPITSNRTFCAGRKDGAGPCKGDSGGGFYTLMSQPGDRHRYGVTGIVSRSLTDNDFIGVCDLYQYAIFTRLESFKNWIHDAGGIRSTVLTKQKTSALVEKEIDIKQSNALSEFNNGNVTAAFLLFREVWDDRRCVLGEDHADTLNSQSWAAYTSKQIKDFEESLRIHNELLATEIRLKGKDEPHGTFHNKAEVLGELGRYQESLDLYDKVIEIRMRLLGPDHEWTKVSKNNRDIIWQKLQATKPRL